MLRVLSSVTVAGLWVGIAIFITSMALRIGHVGRGTLVVTGVIVMVRRADVMHSDMVVRSGRSRLRRHNITTLNALLRMRWVLRRPATRVTIIVVARVTSGLAAATVRPVRASFRGGIEMLDSVVRVRGSATSFKIFKSLLPPRHVRVRFIAKLWVSVIRHV